jgi:type 1 glutamine amidotransferase
MKKLVHLLSILLSLVAVPLLAAGVVYEGGEGPGKGKHIVLVSGDEEYRSEEALPQLGKILAKHHGFKCTVLFAIDDGREILGAGGKPSKMVRTKPGTINPNISNIPGLEALDSADLMVIFTRFRDLPDDQMKHIASYIEAGKPVVGIRTATHAFNIPAGKTYSKYSHNFGGKDYEKGFGRQVLGETWVNHHGKHGSQSTRGIIVKGQESHPILRGIKDGDIWGPTDVYTVNLPLPGDSQPLVLGQVLTGMKFDDPPLEGEKNNPMMPIAWTHTYTGSAGNKGRAFCSTLGAATDLTAEGSRRLLVNACYWAAGLESQISPTSNIGLVGDYQPSDFKSNGFKPDVKPEDLKVK